MTKFSRIAATVSYAAVAAVAATAVSAANIFVVGGKPDDPFWSIVKRGAEDAGSSPRRRADPSLGSGRRTTTTSVSMPRN